MILNNVKILNKIKVLILFVVLSFIHIPLKAQETADEKELIDVAIKVSNEMYKGNYSYFDNLFFLDSFLNRVVLDDPSLRGFNKDYKKEFKSNFSWANELHAIVKAGGLYEPVSFTITDDSKYVTFSQFSNNGLNYHELEFKRINGELRIVDVFVFLNGETLSETIKYLYLGLVNQGGFIDRLTGKNKAFLKDVSAILDFQTLAKAGEFEKLNEYLELTTDGFKQSKIYYNYKITALNGLGDTKSYYEFLKNNSSIGVPSSFLTSIDLFFLEKNWDGFQTNLNLLDEFVGGDPILNNFRGNGFLADGKYEDAKVHFKQVYDDFPDYSYGIIGLLSTGLEQKDANLCVNALADLYDRFGFTITDVENIVQSYPAIKNSSDFKEFLAAIKR